MTTRWAVVGCLLMGLLGLAAPVAAQGRPPVAGGRARDALAQPAGWVAFRATVERDGQGVGRFWRDAHGSTRLELDAPDADGRTIVLTNIPAATYYVFRPSAGWTGQPMVLPTGGWQPLAVDADAAGAGVTEDGAPAYERVTGGRRERRVAALNFFPVVRQGEDGSVERYTHVAIGDVDVALFEPPPGVAVTRLPEPGGIVARPGGAR